MNFASTAIVETLLMSMVLLIMRVGITG